MKLDLSELPPEQLGILAALMDEFDDNLGLIGNYRTTAECRRKTVRDARAQVGRICAAITRAERAQKKGTP